MDSISSDLGFYLEYDFDILTINDLAEIVDLLKKCTSLVNSDILDISDELISRFSNGMGIRTREEALSIKVIYESLNKIPNSHLRMKSIYEYYNSILNISPTVSPVKTPRTSNYHVKIPFIKKSKKLKGD